MGDSAPEKRVRNVGFNNCLGVNGIEEEVFSFRWHIQDFKERLKNKDKKFKMLSPLFKTDEGNDSLQWQIKIAFNGKKYLSLYLYLKKFETPIRANYRIDLLKSDNSIGKSYSAYEFKFSDVDTGWGWSKLVNPQEIVDEKNGLLEDGHLKIRCKITMKREVVRIDYGAKAEIKAVSVKRKNDLSSDFANLYNSAAHADVNIKTKTLELKAHKAILACRSSVFSAMFQHDMSEAINNVVEISDFEPDVVKGMLQYIYCGEIPQELLREKSGALLQIADKYDIKGLKEDMEQAIAKTLSIENVAASIILADMSNAVDLKGTAIKFINMNKAEVMKNEEFRNILRDNPVIWEQLYLAE